MHSLFTGFALLAYIFQLAFSHPFGGDCSPQFFRLKHAPVTHART
jgi:hypothetical protein